MIILDNNNKPVTSLLNTWTEYCEDLCNYKIRPDNNILKKNTMNNNKELLPNIECEEIRSLKIGKLPGLNSIPSELLKLFNYELHSHL